jgi:hypothetical protein
MTDSDTKYFTVDEANATIPYVRSIVEDIVANYLKWRDCIARYEVLAAGSTSEGGESDEQVALRQEVDDFAHRVNGFINELSDVGCVFKGFEGGLVDFRSRLGDRDIYLCWKLGESEVAHWHEVDAGFAGRLPLKPQAVMEETE